MVRILTHTGLVDVTDDHSIILKNGNEISPKDVQIGTELLHHTLPGERLIYEMDEMHNNSEVFEFNNMLDAAKCCYMLNKENKLFTIESPYQEREENRDEELTGADYIHIKEPYSFKVYHIKNKPLGEDYLKLINTHQAFKSVFQQKCQTALEIASSREEILLSNKNKIRALHEIQYEGYVYDLTTENHHFAAGVGDIIVHNTDSVFFTFNLQTPDGVAIRGKEALEITIELAQEAGHLASSFLKSPHDLEYEKTFMPFCLLSKKRYVGMLYETDPNKCKRKEMGIVLKRRDNAPIVKDIYGGIIDILMKQQNIQQSIDFLKGCLQNIVDEKYPIDKLIISKSLRSGYKNPNAIAHKVLADRITARDPGNKPSSGDRIPFVYIHTSNKKALQGDKIETPTYIQENHLKIDYSFYITNQIMKPVQQVFALVLEKIWEMQNKKGKIAKFKKEVEALRKSTEEDKFEDKLEQLKNKEVKTLLFDEYLRVTNNEKQGVQSLTKFFTKIPIH
jgi:hypothetical protein